MSDIDLGHAREGFYRHFVVAAAAAVAHFFVLALCLALALVGQMHASAIIVFFVANAVVAASFLPAWRRVALEHPEAVRAVEAEAAGRTPAFNENRPVEREPTRRRRAS